MIFLLNMLELLCELLTLAIIIRVILSWVSSGLAKGLPRIVYLVTEPLLAPLRQVIPRVGIFDFTPMVAIILLQVIAYLLP